MQIHPYDTPAKTATGKPAIKATLISLAAASLFAALSQVVAAEPIDYPGNYRQWTHVKSMTIHPGHPLESPFLGIHHVYANEPALEGLQDGAFDDGSMFVFDLLQSRDSGNASVEGDRVLIGVMLKDNARFAQTDGWGYQAWPADSRTEVLVSDNGASCHACHAQQKDRDFVFSRWRD